MGYQSVISGDYRDYLDSGFDAGIEEEIARIADSTEAEPGERYDVHRYRGGMGVIEILYPTLAYRGERLFRSPDYIRHMLSVYPRVSDLAGLRRIILRPRYFTNGEVELAALYSKKERTLVEYLHHPHLYESDGTVFESDAPYNFGTITDSERLGTGVLAPPRIKIPSTLYYLYVAAQTKHNDIDKFFLETKALRDRSIEDELLAASDYYSRNGY